MAEKFCVGVRFANLSTEAPLLNYNLLDTCSIDTSGRIATTYFYSIVVVSKAWTPTAVEQFAECSRRGGTWRPW